MRVLNKRYWPIAVRIDYDYRQENDVFTWCVENVGKDKFRIIGSSTYYFQSEEDAVWFKLKWS